MRIIFFLCLLVLFSIPTLASFEGEPIVKNFSTSDYKGGSRIYSTLCTGEGILYAGDKNGVLEFDGENWHKINCGFPVTSMCIGNDNVVYVAGSKGIGKLEANGVNELVFVSLQNYFSQINSDNLRLSKVFNLEGEIVFVLGNEILVITPEQLRIIESPHNFEYYQKLNNKLYLYSPEDGFYEFSNSKLDLIINAPEIKNLKVKGFYNSDDAQFLVTENNGIWEFNGKEISKVEPELNEFLATNRCNGIFQLNDSTFVLNTFYNGFLTFSSEGRIINKYNYNNGLINNTVFSVSSDSWGNLWVGTASGISAIRLEFPLSVYNSREGIGTGYAAQSLGSSIYLATSQGLYLKDSDLIQPKAYLNLFAGHIFGLHKIGSTIYFGHANGFYKLRNNTPIKVSEIPGGWDLKQIPWNENYFISTTVRGIMLYRKADEESIIPVGLIKNTQWAKEKIEMAHNKQIWAESSFGVTRFSLSTDLLEAEDIEHYDRIESGNRILKLRKIVDDLFFIADSGIYRFDLSEQNFIDSDFTKHLVEAKLKPTNILESSDGIIWVFTNKNLMQFHLRNGKFERRYYTVLEYANAMYPTNYENIYELDSNVILIGQEQGFLCYKKSVKYLGPYSRASIRKVQLRSENGNVRDVWGTVSNTLETYSIHLFENISHKENSIKFYYASGCSNYHEVKYQTFLLGYDENWTEWSDESIREFTNLRQGNYRFVVQSINQSEEFSYIASCDFVINPPWYVSRWAFGVYVLLALALVFFSERYFRFRVRKMQQKNQRKQREIEYRKQQAQIQGKLQTEKELIRLKNEKLKTDILYKSKELADSTMNVIEKNRFLTEIKTELEEIKQLSEKNKLVTNDVAKVIRKINRGIDNEENWKVFEDYFDNVHENFFKKMKKKYPVLTAKDLRLCAYLRMNISTKEIAPLLNISVRGVEISRYRLRKKIGIGKDENLIDFLLKI